MRILTQNDYNTLDNKIDGKVDGNMMFTSLSGVTTLNGLKEKLTTDNCKVGAVFHLPDASDAMYICVKADEEDIKNSTLSFFNATLAQIDAALSGKYAPVNPAGGYMTQDEVERQIAKYSYCDLPIFTPMFFDYNPDLSTTWIKATPSFTALTKKDYSTAFNTLEKEYREVSSTLSTDTYIRKDFTGLSSDVVVDDNIDTLSNKIEIQYYRANNGHKIVLLDNNESSLDNFKNLLKMTGTCWYYGLNVSSSGLFFTVPYTTHGFNGIQLNGDNVAANKSGDMIKPTLPQSDISIPLSAGASGTYGITTTNARQNPEIAAEKSIIPNVMVNSIYQRNATVQPPATSMNLYFYSGQTHSSLTEKFNIELITSADYDLSGYASKPDSNTIYFIYEDEESDEEE